MVNLLNQLLNQECALSEASKVSWYNVQEGMIQLWL